MPKARAKAVQLLERAEEVRNNIETLQITLQKVLSLERDTLDYYNLLHRAQKNMKRCLELK
jgi:hypothetical protein